MAHADLYQPLWMLLAFVALGWICARRLALDPRPIATLLIYIIAPLTFFRGLVLGDPGLDDLLLTAALFALSSIVALLVSRLVRPFFAADEAALLAFSSGTGNTGYFGLPIAMVLLPPEGVTQYLFCLLGINLFEFTVGFYLSARGRFSVRQSLIRIARLPLIYAFLAALLVSGLHIPLPGALLDGLEYFKYCYTVLGMMIIGMTLGRVSVREFDTRFIATCVAVRYALWPLISVIAVWLLQASLGIDATLATALLLIGVVPMAANVVVVAMELNIRPEKGAIAVLLTTLVAPVLIPPYLGALLTLVGLK